MAPLALVAGFLVRTALKAKAYDTIVGGAGLVGFLAAAVAQRNVDALIGGAGVIISSLVIGTEGRLFGVRRVDLFHYGFGLAVWYIARSFLSRPL